MKAFILIFGGFLGFSSVLVADLTGLGLFLMGMLWSWFIHEAANER